MCAVSCRATMLVRVLVDPPTDLSLSPIQLLACAVIRQAIDDLRRDRPTGARSPSRVTGMRQRAVLWLDRDDDGFRTWCGVAGIDPEVILARVMPSVTR